MLCSNIHLKVVVEEEEEQTTLLREVEMSIIRDRSRSQVPTSTHLKIGFGGAGGAGSWTCLPSEIGPGQRCPAVLT
jgi:hypothetical protein